jgi:hypothetical protein
MIRLLLFVATFAGSIICALTCLGSGLYSILAPRKARKAELLMLASAFGFVGPPVCAYILQILAQLRPMKLDYYVFNIDGLLGFEPSFAAGALLQRLSWLQWTAGIVYDLMAASMVVVFALYLFRRSLAETGQVAATFWLNLFGALPIYLLFPVCGPKYVFDGFPFHSPGYVTPHAIALLGPPPNGVPSVHTSTALLTFWFLRHWTVGRISGGIFVALTILATLGTGEHYLFDLLVAVPYAMLVEYTGSRLSQIRSRVSGTAYKLEAASSRS